MTFAYPIVAIAAALAVPLILIWEYRKHRDSHKRLADFLAPEIADRLTGSVSTFKKQLKAALLALGVACILLAIARPQAGYLWQEVKRKGIDVVFAIDTSKSMLAQDIKPNRLERSKLAVLDFLEKMGRDRVGLVAFSGNAFLQCPLTLDYGAFRLSLESLDAGIIPVGGTDIAGAIETAEAAFKADSNYKIIVLITDGEDLEQRGIEIARKAASRGIRVFTLGVGSSEGELIPITNDQGKLDYVRDLQGNVVRSRLDADTLKQIAAATSGFYQPLGSFGEGLEAVFTQGLQEIPKQDLNARIHQVPIERYPWMLGLGLLFLAMEWLVGTRRKRARNTASK